MDDHMGKPNLKMNANELLAFQRDLKQEKELLLNILSKIDNQVHRLQVHTLLISFFSSRCNTFHCENFSG